MPHQELIGTEVGGRYKIVRLIDQGGMGAVYEVVHKLLGRKFAMKTLATHLVGDNDALERFRREAELIATLHHPNIIDVIDWEQLSSGTPCIVLELLRGENLAARIARTGQLDWPTIATIGDQVLSALEAAHRANIVHRDLKPQNVFLAEDDTGDISVKLLDFGVSKIRHGQAFQTTDDRLLGTPAFMSPEQADGRQGDIGPQTDVWAMGALLFMMATGKPPFPASSIPQLLYRICHGEPLALVDHRDDAPVAFAELVGRALSRDAPRRITSARELRRNLRAALGMATPSLEADPRHDDDDVIEHAAPAEVRPVAPASGTITFLLIEIEGSAQLWERHPESMNESIARHDALMRAEIERQGGYVFKSIGDAIHAAFSDPIAAALAATEAQRRVSTMDWGDRPALRARMALHTGPAHERGGDYFGPTLHRIARMLALAHGGQILVSGVTEALLRPELSKTYGLVDLGIYRLRDLTRPEHIHQLVHPELTKQFETLRTTTRAKTNLPKPLSSFVGRRREIEEVKTALANNRLVTVTGLGGCGKTRLSIQAAANQLSRFPDGVWFVELASLTDPTLVPQTIAEVIDLLREGLFSGSDPWLERLSQHLQEKQTLLVLDNCEHLTRACSAIAQTLLSRCEKLSILATSREPLSVPGELTYPLSPFPVMTDGERLDFDSIESLDSVRLFVDRARLNQPSFKLSKQNATVILRICRQVDGIPLAIELAAARLTVLSAESIDARLRDRFALLRRTDPGLAPRQRSLRGLLDWSYELLDAEERRLLSRLAVFRGGFPLAAVEAICAGDGVDEANVLDLLHQLVQKSLLRPARDSGEPRYQLLETVREYAQEKLTESGEGTRIPIRHCDWYMNLAESAETELKGRNQASTLDLLESEFDNIRAALGWSIEHEAGSRALRIGAALWWFWMIRGHLSEGRHHLERALTAASGADASTRSKALAGCGLLTVLSDPIQAKGHLEKALAIAHPESSTAALAHVGLGWQALCTGNLPVMKVTLSRARELFLGLGEDWGRGLTCMFLGLALDALGDRDAGESACSEAVDAFKLMGDSIGLSYSLINWGEIPRAHGDNDAAIRLYEEGLALSRELGDRFGMVVALTNLGMALSAQGKHQRAQAALRESLSICRTSGFVILGPCCLLGLAGAALTVGNAVQAARLMGASQMLLEALGVHLHPADQVFFEKVFYELREHIEHDRMIVEWERGRSLSPADAFTFALADIPPA